MDAPILKQEDFLPAEKPRVPNMDLPSFKTATSGNPPILDPNDFVPDASKVADVYPLHSLTDMPIGDLYDAHSEVKEGIQNKRDEGLIRSFKARYRQTDFGLRQSWLAYQELIGNHNSNFEMEMAKLDGQIAAEEKYVTDKGLFDKAVNSFATLLPTAIDVGKEGVRGGMVTSMAVGGTAALLAPPTAPAMAASAFVAGSSAFSAKYMSQIEAGSMYKDLYNLKDSEGNTIDPAIVKTFSMAVGVVNGAIEAAQVKLLLKTVPGLDKVMSDIVKNSVIKLLKDGTIKAYLLGAAGRYAKFLAVETSQEITQEIVAIVGEEMAKEVHENLSDVTIPHSSWGEILDRIKETAVTSALGFGVMGAPGHIMQVMPGLIDRKSQVTNAKLKDILPPDREIDFDKEITNTYERVKNVFWGQRDTRVLKNKNEGVRLKKEFNVIVPEGQSVEEAAIAVQLYIDSKTNPDAVEAALRGEKYIAPDTKPTAGSFTFAGIPLVKPTFKPLSESKKLSETQIRLIEMSKNLTKEQKEFANNIIKEYEAMAAEGLSQEVIFNTRNNYVNRSWITKKKNRDAMSRLTGTTIHAKERRIPTIVEGWTEGLKMTSHSAIDNLTMYKDTMIKTIEQKRLINSLMNGKTIKGNPILTTEKLPTYEQVNMPTYSITGKRTMFAPRKIARNLNNIFGKSGLYDAPGVEQLTKLNAVLKKIALSTSFFHNIAFMRSFYLGGKTMQWGTMNPFTAHREGVEMIHNMDKIIELGVYNGLTLNIIQDWEEDLISMKSDIDKITDKHTKSKRVRGLVSDLWKRQVEFTFGVQGAGLKAKAFAIEFMNEVEKNPNENVNKIAARVASLMNADFGGLHLERMGRNPTLQHIFRLVALAPDWCVDSKTRAMTKTGWKYYHELEIGEEIMMFDPVTKMNKWGKLNNIYVNKKYNSQMIQIRNFNRSILMTPNHTCYVYNSTTKRNDIVKAYKLQTNHQIPRCADFKLPDKPVYEDTYVELVGWFVTDGYTKTSYDGLYTYGKITQSKPDTVKILSKFNMKKHIDSSYCNHGKFKANYYKSTFTIPQKYFMQMQKDKLCKGLNWEFLSKLTKRQLQLLYDTMFLGDGTGQRRFCGKEKEVFYMTLIQTMLGLPSTFYQQEKNCWRTRWITRGKNISCWGHKNNKCKVNYTGTIWCPSVDTGFWLAEREGLMFITGNTESNIQTITRMFGKTGGAKQRQLFRRFWLRVVLKTATATALTNVLLAGGDFGEAWKRYKAGVEADWKNVASVDITPIYNLFGMNPRDRKYFTIAGHFLDPAKYVHDPYRSVQYKMSMLGRMTKDLIFQENWQGKRFKNLAEIPMDVKEFTDYMNPDTYVTYKPPKEYGGFLDKHFSFPAYMMNQIIGSSPIAFQNLLATLSGEITAMDGIMNTLGIRQRKERKKKGRGGR